MTLPLADVPAAYRVLLQGPAGREVLRFGESDGDRGRPLRLSVDRYTIVEIQDAATGRGPQRLVAQRAADRLLVFFGRREFPDLILDGFFEMQRETSRALAGRDDEGRLFPYAVGRRFGLNSPIGDLAETPSTLELEGTSWWGALGRSVFGAESAADVSTAAAAAPSALVRGEAASSGSAGWFDSKSWLPLGLGGLVLAASGGGGQSPPAAPAPTLTVGGVAVPGDFVADVSVALKSLSGTVLGSTTLSASGRWEIQLPITSVAGLLLVSVSDTNGASPDYRDPFTGQWRALDAPLRTFLRIGAGSPQEVGELGSNRYVANVSPLTELLVRLNESRAPGVALTADTVREAGIAYSAFWGLSLNELLAAPVALPALDAPVGPLAALDTSSVPPGLLVLELFALSDHLSLPLAQTLDLLVAGLSLQDASWRADATTQALLRQAQHLVRQSLAQRIEDVSVEGVPASLDWSLALSLRPIIDQQSSLPDGRLRVGGFGHPGQNLQIRMPDGAIELVTVGLDGRFERVSSAAQNDRLQPVSVQWLDLVRRASESVTPLAPYLDAVTTYGVSGKGLAGQWVELVSDVGEVLAQTRVDQLGHWRLSWPEPLSVDGSSAGIRSRTSFGDVSTVRTILPDPSSIVLIPALESSAAMADAWITLAEAQATDAFRFVIPAWPAGSAMVDLTASLRLPDGRIVPLNWDSPDENMPQGTLAVRISTQQLDQDGRYSLSVYEGSGAVGQATPEGQFEFVVKRSSPLAPAELLLSATLLAGRVEPGAGLVLLDTGGEIVRRVEVNSVDGSFVLSVEGDRVDGVAAIDSGEQMSAVVSLPPSMDGPMLTAVIDDAGAQQGAVRSGAIIDDRMPRLIGRLTEPLQAGEFVEVWYERSGSPAILAGTAMVSGLGLSFDQPFADPLPDGRHRWWLKLVSPDPASSAAISNRFSIDVSTEGPQLRSIRVPDASLDSPVVNLEELSTRGGLLVEVSMSPNVKAGDVLHVALLMPDGETRQIRRPLYFDDLTRSSLELLLPFNSGWDDGDYSIDAKILSMRTGQESASESLFFALDASRPIVQGGLDPSASSDTGVVGDWITSNAAPTLSGSTEPGATVRWSYLGQIIESQADSAGQWSLSWPGDHPLPDGLHQPLIDSVDQAGNRAQSPLPSFLVDTVVLSPVAELAPASDTGTLGDGLTADRSPRFTGVAEPGARVRISVMAGEALLLDRLEIFADPVDGAWQLDLAQDKVLGGDQAMPPLADGEYALRIEVQDLAGNIRSFEGPTFQIDATRPAAPTINLVISVGGQLLPSLSPSPAKIADPNPLFLLSAESGARIEVFEGDDPIGLAVFQTHNGSTDLYVFDFPDPLALGEYALTAIAQDPAGNRSFPSNPFLFEII